MQRMPRIWLLYTEFLISQKLVSKTREVFDRALVALPVTQHPLIWDSYVEWILEVPCLRTAKFVINRYLTIEPEFKEEFAIFLTKNKDIDGAAKIFYEILEDDRFVSKQNKSTF